MPARRKATLHGKLSVQRALAFSIAARSEPDPSSFVLSTTNVRAIFVVAADELAPDSVAVVVTVRPSKKSGATAVSVNEVKPEPAAGQTTRDVVAAVHASPLSKTTPSGRLI